MPGIEGRKTDGRCHLRSKEEDRLNRRTVGSEQERVAAAFLIEQGYEIRQMNFRCRSGEIDIVASEGRYLVFVEVKYRSSGSAGDPLEAVGKKKQRQISRTASVYLHLHGLSGDTPCRFDVVGITGAGHVRLVRNAFDYC